ncbi:hypothetical protein F6X38_19480 [Aureimonas leprariae]|uniref:Phytase-like domain-containing protein n=2 Tax=Plantimonas leprariae TaxID=2615207 RepID=A0A7V7PLC3_9HYPH|nr:hypothetical protein F6X38_19480 [Aureimonas leprariae]
MAPGSLPPGPTGIDVASRVIRSFDRNSAATRFGGLEYVGGFSYSSRSSDLKGVSAIRMLDQDRFLAVEDTGWWFAGTITRDGDGRPTGIRDARLSPILNPGGQASPRKGDADAEGLAIDANGDAVVAFERNHRIAAFADARSPFLSRPRFLPLPIPRKELRINAGIEALARSPANSPLGGRLVAVAERSIDMAGNFFAAILGDGGGVFTIRRDEAWSATDGAFLPDGDFLLLERRYQGFTHVGMRIRRIPGGEIRPGALVDGPVLIQADLAEEIDNMEGLDVYKATDGSTRVVLVSDDNGSFLQRNLFLEFRLAEGAAESN